MIMSLIQFLFCCAGFRIAWCLESISKTCRAMFSQKCFLNIYVAVVFRTQSQNAFASCLTVSPVFARVSSGQVSPNHVVTPC